MYFYVLILELVNCLLCFLLNVMDSFLIILCVLFLMRMLQTFSQLCAFDYSTKSVQIYKAPWFIQDTPRFQYRGLLIGNLKSISLSLYCSVQSHDR